MNVQYYLINAWHLIENFMAQYCRTIHFSYKTITLALLIYVYMRGHSHTVARENHWTANDTHNCDPAVRYVVLIQSYPIWSAWISMLMQFRFSFSRTLYTHIHRWARIATKWQGWIVASPSVGPTHEPRQKEALQMNAPKESVRGLNCYKRATKSTQCNLRQTSRPLFRWKNFSIDQSHRILDELSIILSFIIWDIISIFHL